MVDGELRIIGDPPLIVPIEEVAGDQRRPARGVPPRRHPLLSPHARRRPAQAARALPLRPRRPQGGRGRQRRHPSLDLPDARPRRRRSAVPPVQGGAAVGARAVPRPQRVREQRPAGRRGPAADAGGERHHARLDQGRRRRRRQARLLHPPALGREDVGAGRVHGAAGDGRSTRRSAGASSPAPTRAPATGSRSRATSATATPSTGRSPSSPSRTPTRTSVTTRR